MSCVICGQKGARKHSNDMIQSSTCVNMPCEKALAKQQTCYKYDMFDDQTRYCTKPFAEMCAPVTSLHVVPMLPDQAH